MASESVVVIVNPNAKGAAVGKRWPALAAKLRAAAPLEFASRLTQGPGHATQLTREALRDGAAMVVAVGGDGTINEVVNGFFDGGRATHPAARFGVLPLGTGGDFRRTLGMPTDAATAARVLAAGKHQAIDVGLVTFATAAGGTASRAFVNVASFGVSGEVVRIVNQSGKRLGGRLTFMLASLRASAGYENQRVRLTFDDDTANAVEVTLNVCAVANGRYFGGGMQIAPHALLEDGAFDVTTLGDLTFAETLGMATKIYRGAHLGHPKATSRRARAVEAHPLTPQQRVSLDIDGEGLGQLPARFAVLPSALRVVIP